MEWLGLFPVYVCLWHVLSSILLSCVSLRSFFAFMDEIMYS